MRNKKYILSSLIGVVISFGFGCNSFPMMPDANGINKDDGKYGYVDKTGNFIVPPTYAYATDFKKGLATVGNLFEGDYDQPLRYGLINTKGQIIIPIKNTTVRWEEPSYGDGLIPWDTYNRRDFGDIRELTRQRSKMTRAQLIQSQKCGYKNMQGQLVIPAKLDTCFPFSDGLAIAGTKVTTTDPAKITMLTKQFKNLPPGIQQWTSTEFGLIDKTGRWVIPPVFTLIKPSYQLNNIYDIEISGKKGYVSKSREVVIIPDFGSELYSSQTHDLRYSPQKTIQIGILDNSGKIQIQRSFNWLTEFDHGLAIVKMNNQSYWIEMDGKLHPVSELEYSNDLAIFQTWDGSTGFVDRSYKWAIKPRKWSLTPQPWEGQISIFHDGRAILKRKASINESAALEGFHINNSAVRTYYRKIGRPEADIDAELKTAEERAKRVYLHDLEEKAFIYGAIDKTGNIVIEPKFPQLDYFSEGLAVASDKRNYGYTANQTPKYGYIDPNGNWIIPQMFARAHQFKEDLAAVKTENGLWGFIDKTGKFILRPKYAFARDFDHGYATVITGQQGNYQIALIDHKGQILNHPLFDPNGNLVLHPDYKALEQENDESEAIDAVGNITNLPKIGPLTFKDGMARVISIKGGVITDVDDNSYNGKFNPQIGFLNTKGQLVIPPQFDEAEDFVGGVAKVKGGNGLWGYIDKLGRFVVPPKCTELGPFVSGLARCKV